MVVPVLLLVLVASCFCSAFHSHHDGLVNEAYLRSVVSSLAEVPDPLQSYDYNEDLDHSRFEKNFLEETDYDDAAMGLPKQELNLRDPEYLHHSSLLNSLRKTQDGPDVKSSKTAKPSSDGKTENVLPAYCNPPNPCPIGYTREKDGCLEEFENSAAFSREYQAAQDCMCDTEHMFDCPSSNSGPSRSSSVQNAGGNIVDTAIRQIMSEMQGHKSLVAKKLFTEDRHDQVLHNLKARAQAAASATKPIEPEQNPFLQGEKLPIAAKKGISVM